MINRILSKLYRIGNDISFNTGLFASRNLRKTQNTILMYHGIDQVGDTRFNTRHTSKNNFYRQIQFLKKYCHIISLEDFFEERFLKGKPNIVLTFDDGYRNNFLFAKPILEEAQVNGTFYITGLNEGESDILWADFLNIASSLTRQDINVDGENFRQSNGKYFSLDSGKNLYSIIKDENANTDYKVKMMNSFKFLYDFKADVNYDDYWKLMTDKEILKCSESKYLEIGSHGFLHNNLGTITQDKAYKEISDSKIYLENVIQKKIVSIGYPDGSYSRETIDSAENLGFLYQTAVAYNFPEDESDKRIHDRSGVYTCDSCANQILSIL